MELGKLSKEQLEEFIFSRIHLKRSEVLKGAGVGEDCAVLSMGEAYTVLSTDPITAAKSEIGSLAVHVNANDIASAGAEPVALLVTLLLPKNVTEEEIEEVAQDLMKTADELNIDLVGGHTEVTGAVNTIVVSATIIGKTTRPIFTSGAKEGDVLILTKYAGIEGTLIMLSDYEAELSLTEEEKKEKMTLKQMLSVVMEGRLASAFQVHAMHDVTEGGVLGAVYEVCTASKKGVCLELEKIPILPITKRVSEKLNIDPLKLTSSGSMLISCGEDARELIASLEEKGIKATAIGKVLPKEEGLFLQKYGKKEPLLPVWKDEIYSV